MYGGGNTFEGVKAESIAQEDPIKLAEYDFSLIRHFLYGTAEAI